MIQISARIASSFNRLLFAVVMAGVIQVLQPSVALADDCSDIIERDRKGELTPGWRDALFKSLGHGLDFGSSTLEERQKRKCEASKAFSELGRLQLNASRQVHRICGGRETWDKCDLACQESQQSAAEKKASYDCSEAGLTDARNAEQDRQQTLEKKWKDTQEVTDACAEVSVAATAKNYTSDLEALRRSFQICSADIDLCQSTRDYIEKRNGSSAGLTCPAQEPRSKPTPVQSTPGGHHLKPLDLDGDQADGCAMIASDRTTKFSDNNEEADISKCNKGSDVMLCQSTKKFILEKSGSIEGLTCDGK